MKVWITAGVTAEPTVAVLKTIVVGPLFADAVNW
jgi:hypothetical protein